MIHRHIFIATSTDVPDQKNRRTYCVDPLAVRSDVMIVESKADTTVR